MVLAIDGYEANANARVGIGRYAYELIDHIAKRQKKPNAPFDEVRVYVPERVGAHMPQATENFRYRVILPKQLWTFIALPLALALDTPQPDVVFSPTHYIPRWVRRPRVMAIMDVSYLTYPELFLPSDLHKLINWTAYSVSHTAKIITISQFSKRAIIDSYHVPDVKVVVAYPALPDAVSYHDMGNRVTHTLPKRYILSVGTLQPRKNFSRLIEAFSLLDDKEIGLVIVGKKGWLYDDILDAPRKFGVAQRVHFLDFVPDRDLVNLYKNAACFALPSLYEGFGMPVLEAMANGVPVVISKSSSLPEIAGEAGIYVDPTDSKSIAAGLMQALSEKGKDRSDRLSLGKVRVKEFTWDKAAKQVMDVLVDVGKKGTS